MFLHLFSLFPLSTKTVPDELLYSVETVAIPEARSDRALERQLARSGGSNVYTASAPRTPRSEEKRDMGLLFSTFASRCL